MIGTHKNVLPPVIVTRGVRAEVTAVVLIRQVR